MFPRWLAAGLTVLTVTACSTGGTSAAPPATTAAGPLAGVCPATVVVQTDWFPEAEYGAYFQMLGENPAFDGDTKKVTAPLVDGGTPTGVQLEIRFGGPAIGYQQVSAQLYADKTITLGLVSTDEAIQNSAELATVAVAAPLETSPQMIMWDRARHPDVRTIADLGTTGTPVLYYQADTYMQYLLAAGLLHAEQVDGSYDGSPSRWVTSGGDVAEAGFATSEPYIYGNELGEGRSYDVDLQLVADTGYPMYGQALSVRAADKDALAPCLAKLVPIVQRAQVAYLTDPAPTNGVIVSAVQADAGSVWSYSPGLAEFAARAMRERGIVGNGPDATLGNFDTARVAHMIEVLGPVFAGQNKPIKAGLAPEQLVTNEFVDPSIGLPAS
ncbi:MAG: ABC transporter substrate-binding protein [Pseudonocardia sp.]|nr:ABC transporter substrate-binding protein [Pseudonocardia sp.]